MDVKVEDAGTLTKKMIITLPAENVQPRLEEEYNRLRREVKMKGFRRGKVPRSVILKYYQEQVQGEMAEKLVQESYFDVAEQQKELDIVTHPDITKIDYNDDGSFTFVAEVSVRPEFDLGEYKGLKLEKEEVLVEDSEVERELETMRKNLATLVTITDRQVQDGDVVTIDFQGYNNDTPMPQVKKENQQITLGEQELGEEFEEGIIGMGIGEEKTHTVAYPENHYNALFKGKTIDFKIKLIAISSRELPELNDEFAKKAHNGKYDNMEALKEGIFKEIRDYKENSAKGALTDQLMEQLLQNHDFEVPKRLVAYEIEHSIKQLESRLKQLGADLEKAGMNREDLSKKEEEPATKRVRGDFILKKIAETEEIKVDDEDMEQGFQRIADQYSMTVVQVKEFFKNRDDLLPFMNELLNEKILKFLLDNSDIVDVPQKKVEGDAESSENQGNEG